MKISLLVIRCKDIESSKSFYQKLGLCFSKEKHRNGPEHYSCEHNGSVFELYPNMGVAPEDNSRLGFKVVNLEDVLESVVVLESYEYSGNMVYVVADPDGRKVEISERG